MHSKRRRKKTGKTKEEERWSTWSKFMENPLRMGKTEKM